MTSKAVFLDKDGTLVEDIQYNVDPDRIRLVEGALEALRLLQDQGYQLIVVSNQSGIARGLFEEHDLHEVRQRIRELLSPAGIVLTDFYYCPHHPEGKVQKYAVDCFCRKPQPGMLYRAAMEHDVRLADSWMVGDTLHDVEAGNRAGCKTILINNQHETDLMVNTIRRPRFVVKNLEEAARAVLWGNLVGTEVTRPVRARTMIF